MEQETGFSSVRAQGLCSHAMRRREFSASSYAEFVQDRRSRRGSDAKSSDEPHDEARNMRETRGIVFVAAGSFGVDILEVVAKLRHEVQLLSKFTELGQELISGSDGIRARGVGDSVTRIG